MHRHLRLVLFCVAVALVGAGLFLPLASWLSILSARLHDLGPVGAILFLAAYVCGVTVFVPAWTFSIAAGLLYGVWGIPLAWLSMMTAACLAFILTRAVLAPSVHAAVQEKPQLRNIADVIEQDGWRMVLLVRISGIVPFGVQNCLLGITRIGIRPYMSATAIGVLPGVLLYAGAGAFGQATLERRSSGLLEITVLIVSIVAALSLVVITARRLRAKLKSSRRECR